MSGYREYRPAAALRAHASCLWTDRSSGPRAQRVVPDGCLDLLWLDGRLVVTGPDTGPREARLPPGGLLVGLRLRPGAGSLLLGKIPAERLRDRTVDVEDLWGVRGLAEQFDGSPDVPTIGGLVQRIATGRLALCGELDPVVMTASRALDVPAPLSVMALADRLGVSERSLRRRITGAVGYGPKTLARILRFQRVLRDNQGNLADLAAAHGYADQAHLSREFRRLAGHPPSSGRTVA
ncbi:MULTISPECIES: helix-turn-helix transcriptional regulator [unclassified Crossiella]|uniref:helix-turn-helix transcriptional regulator n=1 Tax=unclassified Crossiella TaxID=2620835 RepID=UPI001FFFF38B|nr:MULTISPECIES: helix-turn-helix transcriptional regulator [unclassified Crossiella]MCK2243136.1 helix-turn-helix transcriptional regulator [Crossiella sp. S99.2]MCK2257013.1 helix-turn-helix transcriptional regulator [Crossiella sp. S99.1]